MNINERFSAEVLISMQEHLDDARRTAESDTEILWVGCVDQEGRVVEVTAAARGSAASVPALFPHMSRGDAVIHNHPGGVSCVQAAPIFRLPPAWAIRVSDLSSLTMNSQK